ncbi:histidine kinase-like ATPase [Globomyces pollinis-pini]|nr:histidine kinase-like ATPase [Globomyces pollinis-pini]
MIAKLIKLDVQSQLKIANNQAILTPDKAIKELIENSLDANSTQILVSIKNSALDSIIIKDDGSGVSPSNCLLMGLPYSTSKIAKFDDIHSISTYGFRGQALNAIRLLSRKITFSTRTVEDKIGRVYNLNCDKEAVEEAGFKAMSTGTIIQIEGLFEKTPVRRQIYQKQSNVICKNIRELIIKYSLIHFKKRFFLKIDNSPALNLNINSSNSLFDALRTHYTNNCTSKLSYFEFNEPSATFQFQLIIPNEAHKSSVDLWRSKPDRTHVFVNNRPIQESMFKKFLKEMQVLCHSEASTKRYPLMVLNVIVPVKDTDVNIEPDKSRVEIDQIDDIINQYR